MKNKSKITASEMGRRSWKVAKIKYGKDIKSVMAELGRKGMKSRWGKKTLQEVVKQANELDKKLSTF